MGFHQSITGQKTIGKYCFNAKREETDSLKSYLLQKVWGLSYCKKNEKNLLPSYLQEIIEDALSKGNEITYKILQKE